MTDLLKRFYKKFSNPIGLLAWIVLFPLLTAALGVWEFRIEIPPGESPGWGNQVAAWVVQSAALVSMLAGVLAALAGVGGMWGVHADGRKALRARESLTESFARWCDRLPTYLTMLLGAQMLTAVAVLVARCGLGVQALMLSDPGREDVTWQVTVPLLLAGVLLWGGVLSLRQLGHALKALNHGSLEAVGVAVTRAQAPGLWRYVGDLARRTGASEPAYLVVGIAGSFYVTADDVLLLPSGQRLQGQTMYLPLTCLSLLRHSEMDAVVAHELGHFVGGQAAYSLGLSPRYHRLVQGLSAIDIQGGGCSWPSKPAFAFITFLLTRFEFAVWHWGREREFAADQLAARVVGHDALARALIRMTAVPAYERAVLDNVVRSCDAAGSDLIALLIRAVKDAGLPAPDLQEEAAIHPGDAPSPTMECLQAVGLPLGGTLVESAQDLPDSQMLQWVRSLFADSQRLQMQLLEDFKTYSGRRDGIAREQPMAQAHRWHCTCLTGKARCLCRWA